jgi:hypothetical protein
MLIAKVEQTRRERRDSVYAPENRERDRGVGDWWTQHIAAVEADDQLLACLNHLWEYPGMQKQLQPQKLRDKAFIKYAERLWPLLAHRYMAALHLDDVPTSELYWQATEFLLTEINRLRWVNGMKYDVNYFTPEPANQPIVDEPEPALQLITTDLPHPDFKLTEQPIVTSDDELDVPEFMSDDFVPTGA